MVVSRSRINAPGYGDLTFGAELEVKSLRILGVTLDSKLTLETHLRDVVSKAARNLADVRRAGKVFDYPRVFIRAISIHMFYPARSIVGLLDSIFRSTEKL